MKCPAGSCGLAILTFMDSKESLIQHCGRQAGNAPLSQSKQAKHPYSVASSRRRRRIA